MCKKINTTNPKSKCLNRKNTKTIETERNKYEILIHSIDAQSYNQSHIHARIHSINPVYKQINKQTATTTKTTKEINEYNLLQIFICECNNNYNNNNKSI